MKTDPKPPDATREQPSPPAQQDASLPPPTNDDPLPDISPPLGQPLRQLALQFAAIIAVLSLAWPYYGLRDEALPAGSTAFAIGLAAFVLASLTRQPWWWKLIHGVFAPLAWAVSLLAIDPGWFLLAFILLLLVYRGAISGQIPLYLSNRVTASALIRLTENRAAMRFTDLGAGIASTLLTLARARPDARFTGIENAPATWLIGWLRTARLGNCHWLWGDLWQARLDTEDVVYAFLSPAAMPRLWRKVVAEMRPGSLFVSNSFAVPDVEPSAILELEDARGTLLYCYQR